MDPRPGRAAIRDATIARLVVALPDLADRIYSARDWPVMAAEQPALLVYVFEEAKAGKSSAGPPAFTVTAQLAVLVRVEAADEIQVEAQLDLLAGAVEVALLNNPAWVAQFERIAGVTTQIGVQPGGERPQGQAQLTFAVQWTEEFPPTLPFVLRTVRMRLDALEPFDATGSYPLIEGVPGAAPAPRQAGPDGRIEIDAIIDLAPQVPPVDPGPWVFDADGPFELDGSDLDLSPTAPPADPGPWVADADGPFEADGSDLA